MKIPKSPNLSEGDILITDRYKIVCTGRVFDEYPEDILGLQQRFFPTFSYSPEDLLSHVPLYNLRGACPTLRIINSDLQEPFLHSVEVEEFITPIEIE